MDRNTTQVICDQTGVLDGVLFQQGLSGSVAPRGGQDDTGKRITFLTNNFALKPELIADLYRQRWKVELFFKWIKQHLRIKEAFLGTSENATQDTDMDCRVHLHVLIAIIKKRLHLPHSLYEILQILSLTMFETTPINQLLTQPPTDSDASSEPQQLVLL